MVHDKNNFLFTNLLTSGVIFLYFFLQCIFIGKTVKVQCLTNTHFNDNTLIRRQANSVIEPPSLKLNKSKELNYLSTNTGIIDQQVTDMIIQAQWYKTFYICNSRMLVTSQLVGKVLQELTLEWSFQVLHFKVGPWPHAKHQTMLERLARDKTLAYCEHS